MDLRAITSKVLGSTPSVTLDHALQLEELAREQLQTQCKTLTESNDRHFSFHFVVVFCMHELIKCPGRVDKVARMFKPGIKVPGLGYHMVPTLYATGLFCTTVRNSCGFRPVPGCVS